MPETRKTLDQRRAKHAWDVVENLVNRFSKTEQDHYAREAKKLPVRILNAGLGQALAFISAKANNKKGLKQLSEDLSTWVITNRLSQEAKHKSLLNSILEGDANFLRMATDETLAYLQWMNRFIEAKGLDTSEDG